eukprot:CAMPEP_0169107300 /NCGR_PEP_ID=MMETSP1015-20121227/24807_1 /TAXON_ID=342587 /ORGANISM="Karlodinium micrum, Strain CCMP2283" /LENGTH=254 /DNA_ID=CAMNT_0009168819 /DNA_START=58 /DNA_END=822 /DNA_ORIENTATION=-
MTTSTLYSKEGVSVIVDGESHVLTLTLDRGECRIHPESIQLLSEALEVVEKAPHPKALVITGTGKFFCNGLDVEWMAKHADSSSMIESFWRFLARLLVLDCHTVCALNGHAFGAGLFIALSCDWRLMRTQQGFVCFPELNLGMMLSVGFAELSKAKLSPAALRTGVLTGQRFNSAEALKFGLIDLECPLEELHSRACELAASRLPTAMRLLNFNAKAFQQMKIELYTDAYRALTTGRIGAPPEAPIGSVPAARL